MRQRPYSCPPPRFAFWSRGEVLRLGVIATACAIPLLISETAPDHGGRRDITASGTGTPSAGRLRAVRMTRLDVTKSAALLLGDADETN